MKWLSFHKFGNISFGLAILLIQLFVFINVSLFFPENSDYWTRVILAYLLMTGIFMGFKQYRDRMFTTKFKAVFTRYVIWFALGLIITKAFSLSIVPNSTALALVGLSVFSIGVAMVHGFVVAVVEENIYRGFLVERIGVLPSQLIFSFMHLVVYQGNLVYMGFALVIGFVLYYIQVKFSPKSQEANIGVHGGYNAAVILGGS